MFDKTIALKILEINDSDRSYIDKIEEMALCAGNTLFKHINYKNGAVFGKRNLYILEAYKVLNGFKSRSWVAVESCEFKPKGGAQPISFKIITSEGKLFEYKLYNIDQLNDIPDNNNQSPKTINIETIEFPFNSSSPSPQKHDLQPIKFGDICSSFYSRKYRNLNVLFYRFGFNTDHKPKTLEETGVEFGFTRERARQIIAKILRRFRCAEHLKKFDSIINFLKTNSINNTIDENIWEPECIKFFGEYHDGCIEFLNVLLKTNFKISKDFLKATIRLLPDFIEKNDLKQRQEMQKVIKHTKFFKECKNLFNDFDFKEINLKLNLKQNTTDGFLFLIFENINYAKNRINAALMDYNFTEADMIFGKIKNYYYDYFSAETYENLRKEYYSKFLLEKLNLNLINFNFKESNIIINEFKANKLEIADLNATIEETLKTHKNNLKLELILKNEASADKYFDQFSEFYLNKFTKDKYLYWKKDYLKNYQEILEKLRCYDFESADNIMQKKGIKLDKYEKIKAVFIKQYLKTLSINIADEQAIAIAKNAKSVLLTARAGSGKTSTIVAKTVFDINKKNIAPDKLLILAFNVKAAAEITHRIKKDLKIENFDRARTFHSLAYNILQPKSELLFDNTEKEAKKELSFFIQKLFREKIWNLVFREKLYEHFRKECQELDELQFNNKETYFQYRRNKKEVTLKGEQVKSIGEKYIADFLFEHGISYVYEQQIGIHNAASYKPDFTILYNNQDYILEHWGIDENDENKSVPEYWNISWQDYKDQINWKRNYLLERKIPLIETSIVDLKMGRESFEKILKGKLSEYGINCKKESKEQLLNRVVEEKRTKITQMFLNYIRFAKKKNYSPDKIEAILTAGDTKYTDRTQIFLKLANKVYFEYEKALREENRSDFDDWLKEATNKVIETQGECLINMNHKPISLKSIEQIIIDEYQDFSLQFYNLISAIKKYNPKLKLFCVGDDWQAINGFAGSELKYFNHFEDYFPEHDFSSLTYNYRSGENIVKNGNLLMKGNGLEARCFFKDISSNCYKLFVDDIRMNVYNDFNQKFILEKDYCATSNKYLKLCYDIIRKNYNKKIIIMSRTNNLEYNLSISAFYAKLRGCFNSKKMFDNNIAIGTIHSYKGKEADIVILLYTTDKNFPLIHPNLNLYEIFGRTVEQTIDEEKRLFYVAITRAKEKVFFLTEKNYESEYLKFIKTIELKS